MPTIKLQTSSVLHLPLSNYQNNFTFVINNEPFNTSYVVADLLSKKISRLHQIDPTISEYYINTTKKGNFGDILSLVNFESNTISEKDIPFLSEIFDELEISTEYVDITCLDNNDTQKTSLDKLLTYQKFKRIYSTEILKETETVAKEFYNLKSEDKNKFENLDPSIISSIICHPKLKLKNEDQLFEIINELYSNNRQYCDLYSNILFSNVSSEKMKEFVDKIYYDDINREIWNSLSMRLCSEIVKNDYSKVDRYIEIEQKIQENKITKEILYNNQKFDGIINFLRKQSNINDEIEITYSSYGHGDIKTLFEFENEGPCFRTDYGSNSWICYNFKKHEIIPTNYTLRTYYGGINWSHNKSWVLEGSKDKNSWTTLNEESNCSYLNGKNFSHTFPIHNENHQSFKYLRIRQTGLNWNNQNFLLFNCIEFYGQLI